MSHVLYMKESRLVYAGVKSLSEWVMSKSETHDILQLQHIHQSVMSYIRRSHVSHMNEQCLMYEWVMSHDIAWLQLQHISDVDCNTLQHTATYQWYELQHTATHCNISVRHVLYIKESCFIYEWVMSHIWMSHVSYIYESCLRCKWVMYHIWMSHVSYMNDSCLIYEWVVSHIFLYKKASSQIPNHHRVATISRLLKIVGLFCRI